MKKSKVKPKGIWIVYSLESNGRIQEILTKGRYAFDFYPDIKTLENKLKKDEAENTLRKLNKKQET